MFSGNEWVILVILIGVVALPALVIVAIVLGTRGKTTTQAASGAMPPPIHHGPVAGWFPDPVGRHEQRYWDGVAWTDAVVSSGQPGTDPL